MFRRIIPVLCALAVAVVPATALAQPAQDPSPAATHGGVVYGDTKYDLQNQSDLKSPSGSSSYDKAISGDTKGNLPRAIAPPGTPAETPAATPAKPTTPVSTPTASNDDTTNGWRIAALGEAAVLAAFALGGFALVARRQNRAPHMGV
ncbi:MAG TPA: hypothetical protein VF087_14385 [Solirubrobacteraceae bacterium]